MLSSLSQNSISSLYLFNFITIQVPLYLKIFSETAKKLDDSLSIQEFFANMLRCTGTVESVKQCFWKLFFAPKKWLVLL